MPDPLQNRPISRGGNQDRAKGSRKEEKGSSKGATGKSFDIKSRPMTAYTSKPNPRYGVRPLSSKGTNRPERRVSRTVLQSGTGTTIKSSSRLKQEKKATQMMNATQENLNTGKSPFYKPIPPRPRTGTRTRTEVDAWDRPNGRSQRPNGYSFHGQTDLPTNHLLYDEPKIVPPRDKDTSSSGVVNIADNETRSREAVKLSHIFSLPHEMAVEDGLSAVDSVLGSCSFRNHFEKLHHLDFKVNEFLTYFAAVDFDRKKPFVVVQFEGVFGCSHLNLFDGLELALSRRNCVSDFQERKPCFIDVDYHSFLLRLSKWANVVVVFQKSNSKTKGLAEYFRAHLGGDILKGIFFKKINNKCSKFISYQKILQSFHLSNQEIFVVSPLKIDFEGIDYQKSKEKLDKIFYCRYLDVEDTQEIFDVVLPLVSCSSSQKHEYTMIFCEDFSTRASEALRYVSGILASMIGCHNPKVHHQTLRYQGGAIEIDSTRRVAYEKIELCLKGQKPFTMFQLVPKNYKEYFDFFLSVTFRNYLKNIRKREDELFGVNVPSGDIYLNNEIRAQAGALYQSNQNLMRNLPILNTLPIYTNRRFLDELKTFSRAVNLRNNELNSIVRICQKLWVI